MNCCSVFERTDFVLCDVPVPEGYPQSQTHSGVFLYNGMYYLTTSPYPSIRRPILVSYFRAIINKLSFHKIFDNPAGEIFENPLLFKGEDNGVNPPTAFKLMYDKPLMDTPPEYFGFPSFNSDPDLFIEDGIIYVLNRSVYRKKVGTPPIYNIRFYLIKGMENRGKFRYDSINVIKDEGGIIGSPCLTKYRNCYILTYVSAFCYNDGKTFEGIFLVKSDTIPGLKESIPQKLEISVEGYLPWHMSLFQWNGKLYTIIACVREGIKQRCWQLLGEFSDDLSRLKIYKTPLTDYASYRASACVREDGEFILYNTTVHEKIKGGKSVDGREVIMAHKPFEQVLHTLRENER